MADSTASFISATDGAKPPRSELLSEHAVLRLEIVDHVAPLLMDPAGQRHKQEPQRMRQRRHDAQRII
jgi:hypothetical protein